MGAWQKEVVPKGQRLLLLLLLLSTRLIELPLGFRVWARTGSFGDYLLNGP